MDSTEDWPVVEPLPWVDGGPDLTPRGAKEWQAFLYSPNADGVALTGAGVVDGSGAAWWRCSGATLQGRSEAPCARRARPSLLEFRYGRGVRIQGLAFENSPAWTLRLAGLDGVLVRNVRIRNPNRVSRNTDGVNVECSQNALVGTVELTLFEHFPEPRRSRILELSFSASNAFSLRTIKDEDIYYNCKGMLPKYTIFCFGVPSCNITRDVNVVTAESVEQRKCSVLLQGTALKVCEVSSVVHGASSEVEHADISTGDDALCVKAGSNAPRTSATATSLQLYRLCFTFMVVAAGNLSREHSVCPCICEQF